MFGVRIDILYPTSELLEYEIGVRGPSVFVLLSLVIKETALA